MTAGNERTTTQLASKPPPAARTMFCPPTLSPLVLHWQRTTAAESLRMPPSSAVAARLHWSRSNRKSLPSCPRAPDTRIRLAAMHSFSSLTAIPAAEKLPSSAQHRAAGAALRSRPRYGRRTQNPTRSAKQMLHSLWIEPVGICFFWAQNLDETFAHMLNTHAV